MNAMQTRHRARVGWWLCSAVRQVGKVRPGRARASSRAGFGRPRPAARANDGEVVCTCGPVAARRMRAAGAKACLLARRRAARERVRACGSWRVCAWTPCRDVATRRRRRGTARARFEDGEARINGAQARNTREGRDWWHLPADSRSKEGDAGTRRGRGEATLCRAEQGRRCSRSGRRLDGVLQRRRPPPSRSAPPPPRSALPPPRGAPPSWSLLLYSLCSGGWRRRKKRARGSKVCGNCGVL